MKNFMNLLRFEIGRFWKLYMVLLAVTVISQIVGTIWMARRQLKRAQDEMLMSQQTMEQYTMQSGKISFEQLVYSPWFQMPVLLCVAVLMIYVFFIWYRDWFAKGSFIYRLLMLPTARIQIYFSKLSTIMLYVLGLVAVQTWLMQLNIKIFNGIIPSALRDDIPLAILYNRDFLDWFYPNTILDFLLLYGLGLLFVAVIFTCILFERSYGWRGIVLAALYATLCMAVFLAPYIVDGFLNYFYSQELLIISVVSGVVLFAMTVWLAKRLLVYKINV